MKLTEKQAIKKLQKGWKVNNDSNNFKKLSRLQQNASPKNRITKFCQARDTFWIAGITPLPTSFNLSDVVFKKKKSKLEKRVERLEEVTATQNKQLLTLTEFCVTLNKGLNKPVDGVFDVNTKEFIPRKAKSEPKPLNPEDLVKGKWYVDEDENFIKFLKEVEGGFWHTEAFGYYAKKYSNIEGFYGDKKPIREATQEELDSFLPEGHEDRSDSKPTDFNTNTKYRKKGDVCLCWNDEYKYKYARFWNETGFDNDIRFKLNMDYDNHQFLGVNILDHE